MSNTEDVELNERISDVFARGCVNNEYFGNDGWYELHTPTVREEIKALIQQEANRQMAEMLDEIINANFDNMHGTYDFDGIAQSVLEKRKQLEETKQ